MAETQYEYFSLSDVPAGPEGVWGLVRKNGFKVERFFPNFGWRDSWAVYEYVYGMEPGAKKITPEHAQALQESGTLAVLDEDAYIRQTSPQNGEPSGGGVPASEFEVDRLMKNRD